MPQAPDIQAIAFNRIDAADWDELAARCDASFRGSHADVRAWAVKQAFRARTRFYRLHLDRDSPPIGQCAVATKRGGGVFLDRLALLPEHQDLWVPAMRALLRQLPSGVYTYGWELNLEAGRQSELAEIDGVGDVRTRPITVDAVEFGRWDSWESYHRAISENVRRNAKKAVKEVPDLHLDVRTGLAALRLLRPLVTLRETMYERKEVGFRRGVATLNTVARMVASHERTLAAVATGGGRPLAAFSGLTFGRNTYYLEGGSAPDNRGVSWFLLVEMLRRAYERDSSGRFVMGYVDYDLHDEARSGGLLRSRRSCRVTSLDTSIVRFSWRNDGP